MYECKKCSYKTEDREIKTCPECNEELVEKIEIQAADQKKKKGLIGVLLTVIILVVATFLIEFISGPTEKPPTENEIKEDMSAFVDKVAEYIPGEVSENGYESEYWGIRISPDKNWKNLPEEDLRALEEKEGIITQENTAKMIEDKEFSQELAEAFARTIYCKVEAGYNYTKDYRTKGVVYVDVVSVYMGKDITEDEIEKSVIDEYANAFENSETGECTLGEEKYSYVDTVYEEDSKSTNMRIYVNVKGAIIQRIKLMYDDDAKEVIKSFESSVSKY